MDRTLFFTIALVAAVFAGCSKDESMEEQERNNMEQTNTLQKEQIVGVWRNGDYWVSFSEDGFMCGYLSDELIAEGDYTIKEDTVRAESSMYYHFTDFAVRHIDDTTLDCSVELNAFDGSFSEKKGGYAFVKADEEPCPKNHRLVGKKFRYITDVIIRNREERTDTFPGAACYDVSTYFFAECHYETEDGKKTGSYQSYYVYRPPFLYFKELYNNTYNYLGKNINILKIEFNNEDIVARRL